MPTGGATLHNIKKARFLPPIEIIVYNESVPLNLFETVFVGEFFAVCSPAKNTGMHELALKK